MINFHVFSELKKYNIQEWEDYQLKWNTSEFNGVDSVR